MILKQVIKPFTVYSKRRGILSIIRFIFYERDFYSQKSFLGRKDVSRQPRAPFLFTLCTACDDI